MGTVIETVDCLGKPVKVLSHKDIVKEKIIVDKRIYPENPPFLTIITRCYKKPKCRKRCIESVDSQEDKDFEHILLIDNIGLGLAAADQELDVFKELYRGKYVMVLDDDDIITNPYFVLLLKDLAGRYDPQLIIWRGYFSAIDSVLPPIDNRWGNYPVRALIGSFNYCVENSIFSSCVGNCTSGMSGDFDFLSSVIKKISHNRIYWLKKILVATQQKSLGKPEDMVE